eukprot:jgi/Mesvir1/7775/Mv11718-RA.1
MSPVSTRSSCAASNPRSRASEQDCRKAGQVRLYGLRKVADAPRQVRAYRADEDRPVYCGAGNARNKGSLPQCLKRGQMRLYGLITPDELSTEISERDLESSSSGVTSANRAKENRDFQTAWAKYERDLELVKAKRQVVDRENRARARRNQPPIPYPSGLALPAPPARPAYRAAKPAEPAESESESASESESEEDDASVADALLTLKTSKSAAAAPPPAPVAPVPSPAPVAPEPATVVVAASKAKTSTPAEFNPADYVCAIDFPKTTQPKNGVYAASFMDVGSSYKDDMPVDALFSYATPEFPNEAVAFIRHTPGDGDCFFHAINLAYSWDTRKDVSVQVLREKAKLGRERLLMHARETKNRPSSIDSAEVIASLQPGQFVSINALQLLAEAWERPIVCVVRMPKKRGTFSLPFDTLSAHVFRGGKSSVAPLFIYHDGDKHFSALLRRRHEPDDYKGQKFLEQGAEAELEDGPRVTPSLLKARLREGLYTNNFDKDPNMRIDLDPLIEDPLYRIRSVSMDQGNMFEAVLMSRRHMGTHWTGGNVVRVSDINNQADLIKRACIGAVERSYDDLKKLPHVRASKDVLLASLSKCVPMHDTWAAVAFALHCEVLVLTVSESALDLAQGVYNFDQCIIHMYVPTVPRNHRLYILQCGGHCDALLSSRYTSCWTNKDYEALHGPVSRGPKMRVVKNPDPTKLPSVRIRVA